MTCDERNTELANLKRMSRRQLMKCLHVLCLSVLKAESHLNNTISLVLFLMIVDDE